jgi:putative SOS response-associated peptidase YedK
MCGRYSSTQTDAEIVKEFGVQEVVGEEPRPSWNVAPTQSRRVVLEHAPRDAGESESVPRVLRSCRWGLLPSWAKDVKIGARLINARSETLTEKPSFRAAAARRRCLVPATGYFEWEKVDGRKVPQFLFRPDEEQLAFAGLYELWPDPERAEDDPDRWVWSYTIITRTAPDAVGHIHDRSPLLVPTELRADWLSPSLVESEQVKELLASIPEPLMTPREVSSAVNSVRNNGPELIEPVAS